MTTLRQNLLVGAVLLNVAAATAAPAAGRFAPPDRPGPPLSVSAADLAASLACTGNLAHSPLEPVLLVPGTATTPQKAFSWNYENAFTAQGRPWCAVTLPGSALFDIQVAGEYLVHAIRTMHAQTGAPIGILGWSQGGMVPRWALRFWPDTRPMVTDLVALDPSNHGTLDAAAACLTTRYCPPAFWQQRTAARFLAALNSYGETFAGIDYTVIYSRTDEVVVPNETARGSSALHTGTGTIRNIAVQTICPADLSEHLAMGTYDPVGYALAIDALDNAGPANPARIDRAVCRQAFQPGVDPKTFAQNFAALLASIDAAVAASPKTASEPPLAPYVFR